MRVWSHLLLQANLFKTLSLLIFAIRADMVNTKSVITFANISKLVQDLNLDHIYHSKQNVSILRVWSHFPPQNKIVQNKGFDNICYMYMSKHVNYQKFAYICYAKQYGSKLLHLFAVTNMCKHDQWVIFCRTFATRANTVKFKCSANICNAGLTSHAYTTEQTLSKTANLCTYLCHV